MELYLYAPYMHLWITVVLMALQDANIVPYVPHNVRRTAGRYYMSNFA